MGTSSICHNEDISDVNEIIDLDHDVKGLEETLILPRDILEPLSRESEGSTRNIEETEVVTWPRKVKRKNLLRLG